MAKRKTNKSEKIRQYLGEHPEASAGEVAKALRVKTALVYNVKSAMKGSAKPGGGRRKGVASANGSVEQVTEAARLIRVCGGISEARAALRAAEAVAAVLES